MVENTIQLPYPRHNPQNIEKRFFKPLRKLIDTHYFRFKVKDADLIQFDDVLKINVTGALALIQKAAQKMVKGQQNAYPAAAADIVIIGSVVGRHVSPFSAVEQALRPKTRMNIVN